MLGLRSTPSFRNRGSILEELASFEGLRAMFGAHDTHCVDILGDCSSWDPMGGSNEQLAIAS